MQRRLDQILNFFRRQGIVPFETMFAFYSLYAGLAGVLHFGITNDVFKEVIGTSLALIFNIGYIVAGLSVYFGIGTRKANIEAFGLITLITSVLIRAIAMGYIIGMNPFIINSYVFSATFISACIVRLYHVLHRGALLAIQDTLYISVPKNSVAVIANDITVKEGC
jgi:hypothetical protein